MWPALVIVSIVVCAWAMWLASASRTPRWVRGVAPVVAAGTIGTGVYALWRLRTTFDDLAVASADQRQRLLSSGIANAYTALAIGWAIAAIAIVALTYASLRARAATAA